MTAEHVLQTGPRARGSGSPPPKAVPAAWLAAALTDVAGSSDVFERGFVTYSNLAKSEDMLGVARATLDRFGAVSRRWRGKWPKARWTRSGAHLCVSVTGIAGPGGSEFKPEGRVCFGLAMAGRVTDPETQEFGPRGRGWVRAAARDHALFLLLSALS